MRTMVDILKERLPEGLEIVKVQDKGSSSQYLIWFAYQGTETKGWLYKTCAPGQAEKNCDFVICSTMMSVALKRNDLDMAEHWMTKQQEALRIA